MAGRSQPPPCDPPDKGRVPRWMLRDDELAQTIVLLMQVRTTENEAGSTARKPRFPPDHFLIGNTIRLALGSGEAEKIQASKEAGGAKYILRTKSKSVSEKLKQIRELIDETPIEIIEHPTLNTVQGAVFDSDGINHSEEYILKNLQSQGVTAVRRIKKRVGKETRNTPITVLTFSGARLPEYVYLGLLRATVRPYYPSPMVCFRCATYGHTRMRCDATKFQQVCLTCSGAHEILESPCPNPEHCKNCGQNHSPISKQCSVYREEQDIIRLKINRNLTYSEARSEYRKANDKSSYAAVANQHTQNADSEKDRVIKALQEQIASLTQMVTELKAQIASNNQQQCSCRISINKPGKQTGTAHFIQPEPPRKTRYSDLTRSSSCDQLRPVNSKTAKNLQPSSEPIEINALNMEYENSRTTKRKGNSQKNNDNEESPERKKCPAVEDTCSNLASGVVTRSKKK